MDSDDEWEEEEPGESLENSEVRSGAVEWVTEYLKKAGFNVDFAD